MDVLKTRDIFYRWTKTCFKQYLSGLSGQQQFCIRLIPLIFQTNNRMLPAYVSADTPAGIYGYRPDKKLVREAKSINKRFIYDQKAALRNTVIDAIYLQQDVLDHSVKLILIHRSDADTKQKQQLKIRMKRLIRWLETEHLYLIGQVITADQVKTPVANYATINQQLSGSSIDRFYFESILLAGKYPLWWLIPADTELNYSESVEKIEYARYVKKNEYLDFGSAVEFRSNRILNSIMDLMRQGYAGDALVFHYCLTMQCLRLHSTGLLSSALKNELFVNKQDLQSLSVNQIFIQTIRHIVKTLFGQDEWENIISLYWRLLPYTDDKFQILLQEMTGSNGDSQELSTNAENNLAVYMDARQSLQDFVSKAVTKIIVQLTRLKVNDNDVDLMAQLLEIYHREFNSPDQVVVINQNNISAIRQDKILVREMSFAEAGSQWVLVVKDQKGDEQLVYQLKSLLALIAWAWLNRIIDQNTQVSIDCPGYQVKQIEVRYALDVLVSELSKELLWDIKQTPADKNDWACKSLIFVRFISSLEDGAVLEDHSLLNDHGREMLLFEQILVNQWGDMHYRQFYDIAGIVRCICDWLNNANLSDEYVIDNFKLYSYSSGKTNYYVQKLGLGYEEIITFFVTHGTDSASYVLNLDMNYFVISQQQGEYSFQQLTSEIALYNYLEQATNSYKAVSLDKSILPNTPITELYEHNHIGVVQVCFQARQHRYDVWVVDERGSLWHSKQSIAEFEQLISHWLFFIRNIVNQYKKAEITAPHFELLYSESNGFAGSRLSKVNTDGLHVELTEPSLSLKCQDLLKGNELSMQIEDRLFDYLEYGEDVINHYAEYILAKGEKAGALVTDIELNAISPGSLVAQEIQFVHFLKLKRRVEFELQQLMSG